MRGTDAARRLTAALDRDAPDLLRYLQRRMNADAAADALAEVMLAAWRRASALPSEPEESRMWLFGVARNVVANADRAERRRSILTERFRDVVRTAPTEGRPADDGAEVRDAIARLAPEQAELIRLVHWDGFTVAAAGALLGVPASTARTRYQRARADLRAALSSDGAAAVSAARSRTGA